VNYPADYEIQFCGDPECGQNCGGCDSGYHCSGGSCVPDCTPGAWVDGVCGDAVNGCPYGQRNQTRSPDCGTPHQCRDDQAICCPTPAAVTVTATQSCNATTPYTNLTWTPATPLTGVTYTYRVLIDGVLQPAVYPGTSATNLPATSGVARSYAVRAISSCNNNSSDSAPVQSTGVYIPASPTAVTAIDDINKLVVGWTDQSLFETDFRIYRKTLAMPYSLRTTVGTSSGPSTGGTYGKQPPAVYPGYTDPGPCGVGYQYCVRSYYSGNPAACRESASPGNCTGVVSCLAYTHGWFQCQGGDIVAAGGQLGEYQTPVNPDNPNREMNIRGEPPPPPAVLPTGVPGMLFQGQPGAFYGDLNSNPAFGNTRNWVNATGLWTEMLAKQENSYGEMKRRAISRTKASAAYQMTDTNINTASLNLAIGQAISNNNYMIFNYGSAPAEAFNVAIIEVANPGGGDVTIGPVTIDAAFGVNNKAVLLIDQGTVKINDSIIIDETVPATAGFLTILSARNISVAGSVGSDPPPTYPYQNDIAPDTWPADISAVMYTDSVFSDGSSAKQLKINGSIAAKGGVNLQRTKVGPFPVEFVHYNPRMIRILRDVGLRRKIVYEEGN